MFSPEQLRSIREEELKTVLRYLPPPGATILEIGGGTGFQARRLADRGYAVSSIDIDPSGLDSTKTFPVAGYDGRRFPFADRSFDAVFSSNVLEHIEEPGLTHGECRRVLKPGGSCVHLVPTAAWRFWEAAGYHADLAHRFARKAMARLPFRKTRGTAAAGIPGFRSRGIRERSPGELLRRVLIPSPHGAHGSALSELLAFSMLSWRRHFIGNGMEILAVEPLRLFYTGHMFLGRRWSVDSRRKASRFLGSACILFKVRYRGR
jgi:SAM-dependent methyltransferase